ncbi:hypothetical protein A2Y83_04830 [Candidatus Falkowbacteria bacterium RBG_13_39_14]|uniref:Uncharacterized protein n=1 Tax=Candidatus Falkowbacteria bacterium RBG_13_39_14 TaxID=1797985 RepID=A0A1F5S1C6_9BACT|nr:MAG: hypothetical protein A2Y83_04830 [Candidatus Falkowbacteria bacterium RBG_13_39_14]
MDIWKKFSKKSLNIGNNSLLTKKIIVSIICKVDFILVKKQLNDAIIFLLLFCFIAFLFFELYGICYKRRFGKIKK